MTETALSIPASGGPGLLAWFLFLIVCSWLLRRYGKRKGGWTKTASLIGRVIPLVDVALVITVLLLVIKALPEASSPVEWVFAAVIFGFLLWIARQPLKDFIVGVTMRIQNAFKPGDSLEFGEGNVTVVKTGLLHLTASREKGSLVSIPYSHLSNRSFEKETPSQSSKSATFEMTLDAVTDISNVIRQLERDSLMLPWTPASMKPSLKIVDHARDRVTLSMTIHALQDDHLAKIEWSIREKHERWALSKNT